ncbi:MAG TPA: hypothetical protein VF103_00535 [Polyangiaceae bacterium]
MVSRLLPLALLFVAGCATILGFEDLEEAPPPPPPVICSSYVSPCPSACSECSLRCVDLETDPSNCGACGTQCSGGRACKGGACICAEGTEACGGLCTKLDDDVMNCGACENVCPPGGACTDGVCTEPTILSTGQGLPGSIVSDGTRLYFSTATGIYSMGKDGSDLQTLTAPTSVVSLAIGGDELFYRGFSIDKIPLAGGTPTNLVPSTTSGALAVDATSVYYADSVSVSSVPIEGGTPIVLTTGTAGPSAIAVDAAYVYFGYSSSVYRTPLDGGSQTLLGSAPTTVQDIELGTGFLYYAASYVGALALDGSSTRELSTRGGATKLAIDAENAYFFEGSTLLRVPLIGGDPTTLAIDMYPTDLIVDDTSVYWVSRGEDLTSGAVMSVAK